MSKEQKNVMEIQTPNGLVIARKLMLNRFNSDRKMMSVLVEYQNKFFLLAKGADNVLLSKSINQKIPLDFDKKVNEFFDEGYRVLFMGIRLLSRDEVDDIVNREKIMQANKGKNE